MILITGALGLLALGVGGGPAPLVPSPFVLTIEPASLRYQQRATVRIERVHVDARSVGRADVYLVSLLASEARYLTPAGAWSRGPVPFARGIGGAEFTPIASEWPAAGPPGWILLGLVVVPEARDPLDRDNWLYQPAQTWVMVRHAPAPLDNTGRLRLAGVTLLTVALALLVVVYPRAR